MRNEYDFSKGKRGPVVRTAPRKTRITIRLDTEVIAWFKKQVHDAEGGNYQTLINTALREHMVKKPEEIEAALRKIIREELHLAS
jgi:uncharacterized protein (DUF4415 family)